MGLQATGLYDETVGLLKKLGARSAIFPDAWREEVGLRHELNFLVSLRRCRRLVCYHGLSGAVAGRRFEVDALILAPPQTVLLVEVKSYQGALAPDAHDRAFWVQNKGLTEERVKNPLFQVKRTSKLVNGIFEEWGSPLRVTPVVQMTGNCHFSAALERNIAMEGIPVLSDGRLEERLAQRLQQTSSREKIPDALLELMIRLHLEQQEPLFFDEKWVF